MIGRSRGDLSRRSLHPRAIATEIRLLWGVPGIRARNCRGRPLTTFEAIVALIGSTRTTKGLRVKARLDQRKYPIGIDIPNNAMNDLSLHPNEFHGEWNYELRPRLSRSSS